MRWKGRAGSDNVEDLRGTNGRGRAAAAGGGGILTIVIILVGVLFFNMKPEEAQQLLQQQQAMQGEQAQPVDSESLQRLKASQANAEQFARVVLKDTEDVWRTLLPKIGKRYQEPTLSIFDKSVDSACGYATSAVGPFYCPGDNKVFLDLSFFSELRDKFKAPGDFACAYVIAHEVGHHIQNLLGLSMEVQRLQQQSSKVEANRLSVRLELQADLLAGIWAHHAQKTKNILEEGDLEEAIRAASRIGDDTLQREAAGYVRPDSFTHGTSEQRVRWFARGWKSGDLNDIKLPFQLDYDQL